MTGGEFGVLFFWAAGLMTLISLGTTIWNLVSSGSRSNAKAIALQAARIEALERKVERQADHLEQAPSAGTLHRLELALTVITGDLGKIEERLKPVAAIAERMQELMLEQARGK